MTTEAEKAAWEIFAEFTEYPFTRAQFEKMAVPRIQSALDGSRREIIDECYLAARGTANLSNPAYTRNQMYWKGRADAANDVRKLK